jgi:AraC-like DNA-binding protein
MSFVNLEQIKCTSFLQDNQIEGSALNHIPQSKSLMICRDIDINYSSQLSIGQVTSNFHLSECTILSEFSKTYYNTPVHVFIPLCRVIQTSKEICSQFIKM